MNALSVRQSRKLLAVFFILLYAVMLIFNFCTPLLADDFNYSYIWACDVRLEHIRDIPASISAHREYTNGRVFSHAFVQFFLVFNKVVFNLVNAAVPVLLSLLLYVFFKRFNSRPVFSVILTALMIWIFCPAFGEVFIWLDGSCNYSWGAAFLMMFLLPFIFHYIGKPVSSHPILCILYIIEAFVAGAYSENGSAAALFCSFAFLILIAVKQRKLPLYLALNFLGGCAGFVYLFTAPSLMAGKRGQISPEIIANLFSSLFSRLRSLILQIGTGRFVLLIFAAAALLTYLILVRKRRKLFYFSIAGGLTVVFSAVLMLFICKNLPYGFTAAIQQLFSSAALNIISLSLLFLIILTLAFYYRADKELIAVSIVFALSAFISLAVFAFAAYMPARSAIHMTFYLCTASVLLLYSIGSRGNVKFVKLFSLIVLILFILSFILGFSDILDMKSMSDKRMDIISQFEGSGRDVELPILTPSTKYSPVYGLEDLMPGQEGWINDMMQLYYGLGKVSGVPSL